MGGFDKRLLRSSVEELGLLIGGDDEEAGVDEEETHFFNAGS